MQAQQHKPIAKKRLNAGEVIVAVVNLILAASGGWVSYIFLRGTSILLLLGSITAATALSTLLAALLIFLRQRRLALYSQWLSVVTMLAQTLIMLWLVHKHLWRSFMEMVGVPLVVMLLLTVLAWLLKRMDDSE